MDPVRNPFAPGAGTPPPELAGREDLRQTIRIALEAECLFDFPTVGALPEDAAKIAIAKPVSEQGAKINKDALDSIVKRTQGYPYFVQEWGKHAWEAARSSPITREDVVRASAGAIAALDESFFRVVR